MQEYDRVSLDRFDGKNLQSTVYFLSHLHEDHAVGLAENIFYRRLKSSKDVFLYCSEVTHVLLAASTKYQHLTPFIKSLAINTPTTLEIPDPLYAENEKVTVTLLPAFHCPGSVMFLLEGSEGTVLYTGDFRWEHFNVEQMHHLRSGESVKKIKSLYVDTTFCTPENLYIPSRQQCIDAVCQLVQEWTSLSPQHTVNVHLRAQYGHEPLLNAIATRLNMKVHVNERKMSVYDRIHEFNGNFTADGTSTQLHACNKQCTVEADGVKMLCREFHDPEKRLVIMPTTMYFTQFQHLTLDKIIKKINSNFYRACYSFHSSYTEVKDLVSYLKPERVYANVKTTSDASLDVTQHRLNTMLKECLETGAGEVIQAVEEVRELGTLKTRSGRPIGKRRVRDSSSEADSLDFGSPAKAARRSLSQANSGASAEGSQTRRGRGRGRGRGAAAVESVSQPSVATRRSSRRVATASPGVDETTPKKAKRGTRSPSPDLFITPDSDTGQQSSYQGSQGSESELSLISSQRSTENTPSHFEEVTPWTAGSFLAAVSSSSSDDQSAGRVCVVDDEEQTDENFEDISQITQEDDEDEGKGLTLQQLSGMAHPDFVKEDTEGEQEDFSSKSKKATRSSAAKKKGKRVRKSKGAKVQEPEDLDNEKTPVAEMEDKGVEDLGEDPGTNKNTNGELTVSNNKERNHGIEEINIKTKTEENSESVTADNGSEVSETCVNSETGSKTDSCLEADPQIQPSPNSTSDKSSSSSDSLLPHSVENSHVPVIVETVGVSNAETTIKISDSSTDQENGSETSDKSVILVDKVERKEEILIIDSDSGSSKDRDLSNTSDLNGSDKSNVKKQVSMEIQEHQEVISMQGGAANKSQNDTVQVNMAGNETSMKGQSEGFETAECRSPQEKEPIVLSDSSEENQTANQLHKDTRDLKSVMHIEQQADDDSNQHGSLSPEVSQKKTSDTPDVDSKSSNTDEDASAKIKLAGENDSSDDDVVEIVDLTGDDFVGSAETVETSQSTKKSIKISLITKVEPKIDKAVKKSQEAEARVSNRKEIYPDSDSDSEQEISSSPEWLSVQKASTSLSPKGTRKKNKQRSSKYERLLLPESSENNCVSSGSGKGNKDTLEGEASPGLSQKEMEERAEVRRQAMGFVCETDSESDTDESTSPDSPTADVLYDDYIELTSDSDNEGGLGGKSRGRKSAKRKYGDSSAKPAKGQNSADGQFDRPSQGWLNTSKLSDEVWDSSRQEMLPCLGPEENKGVDSVKSSKAYEKNEMDEIVSLPDRGNNTETSGRDEAPQVEPDKENIGIVGKNLDGVPENEKDIDKLKLPNSNKRTDVNSLQESDSTEIKTGTACEKELTVDICKSTASVSPVQEVILEHSGIKTVEPETKSDEKLGNTCNDTEEQEVTEAQANEQKEPDVSYPDQPAPPGTESHDEFQDRLQQKSPLKESSSVSIVADDRVVLQDSPEETPATVSQSPKPSLASLPHLSDPVLRDNEPAPPGTEEAVQIEKPTSKISAIISTNRPVRKSISHSASSVAVPSTPEATSSPLYSLFVVGRGTAPSVLQLPQAYTQCGFLPRAVVPVPGYPPPPFRPGYPPYGPRTVWPSYPSRPLQYINYPPVTFSGHRYIQPTPSVPSTPTPTTTVAKPEKPKTVASVAPLDSSRATPSKLSASKPLDSSRARPSRWSASKPFDSSRSTPSKLSASKPFDSSRATPSKWSTSEPLDSSRATPSKPTTSKPSSRSVSSTASFDASDIPLPKSPDSETPAVDRRKPKKLASWQQKKAEMFDRGPTLIAKKDVKPKITVNIGKPPSKRDAKQEIPKTSESMHSIGETVAKMVQQTFQQKDVPSDMSSIKANIAALTGIEVKTSSKSASENLPDLLQQLNKLDQVQAVLQAITAKPDASAKQTFEYGHSGSSQSDAAERREFNRGDNYNRQGSRETEDRKERVYDRRELEYDYERRERDYDRKESDYDRRERDYDYDRRVRDYVYGRERDYDYGRRERDRDYFERREREFERRLREEEEYERWFEERRRYDPYGRDRLPPRGPAYDDYRYDDRIYERPPPPRPVLRDPEYEEWLERRRFADPYRNLQDPYHLPRPNSPYGYSRPRSPIERPTSERYRWAEYDDRYRQAVYTERPYPERDLCSREDRYLDHPGYREPQAGYGSGLEQQSDQYEHLRQLPDQYAGGNPPETSTDDRGPAQLLSPTATITQELDASQSKKPIMARVLSRSGHLLGFQSTTDTPQ